MSRRPSPAMPIPLTARVASFGANGHGAATLTKSSVTSGVIKDGPHMPKGDPGHVTLTVRAASATRTATMTESNVHVTAKCNPGEMAAGGGAHSVTGVLIGDAPTAEPLDLFTRGGVSPKGAWGGGTVP